MQKLNKLFEAGPIMRRIIFVLGILLLTVPATVWLSGCNRRPVSIGNESENISVGDALNTGDSRYRFPQDHGGELLEAILVPAEEIGKSGFADKIQQGMWKPEETFKEPELPLPPINLELAPSSMEAFAGAIGPSSLLEEPPLYREQFDATLPEEATLPVGPRVRVSSPRVNDVASLPLVGVPQGDLSWLDDPGRKISKIAALTFSPADLMTPAKPTSKAKQLMSGRRLTLFPEEQLLIYTPGLPGK